MNFSKGKTGVYCFSLLLIIGAVIWFCLSCKKLPKYDYSLEDWWSENASYTDQGLTANEIIKDSGINKEFLWGPFKSLKRGSYTAVILYSSEQDQFVTAERTPLSIASSSKLSRHLNSLAYQFEIKEDTEKFELVIYYGGIGDFSVKSISIVANNRWNKRVTAELIFSVLIFDLLFYLFTERTRIFHTLLVILGITGVSALPLASYGIHYGHDIAIHLLRIEAIFQALHFGQFPARISSVTLFGLGYPFSIYYNDLFLYFPAFLRLIGFSVITAYKLYIFAVLFLTAAIAYYSFKNIFSDKRTGFILAFLYTTASYHFTNIYVRAAVGEYTAQIFLPLLALALFKIFTEEVDSGKKIFDNSLLLSIGLSGIIGSHILTMIMTCFLLLIVCLILWKKTFTKNVLLTFLLTAGLTILLNLYFLVPFVDYYFNVPTVIKGIVDQGRKTIQDMGIQPAQLFSFFQKVVGSLDLKGQDRIQCTPGLPLMAVLIIGLFKRYRGRNDYMFRFLLFLSVFTLIISTDVFPWNWLAYRSAFWSLTAQIQIPARFLVYSILFLTLLAGEILQEYDCKYIDGGLVCAAVLMFIWCTGSLFDNQNNFFIYDTSGVDPFQTGLEYYLQGSDYNLISTKIVAENIRWSEIVSRTSDSLNIHCMTDQSNQIYKVFVPVYNYKGYHVTDASGKEYEIINGEQNHIGFELPDSFDGVITVKFRDPAIWTAALYVSAVSLLLLIILLVLKRSAKDQRLSKKTQ